MKNAELINSKIKSLILDIKTNTEEYINIFNKKINKISNYINDLNEDFEVEFKYKNLTFELYKFIEENLLKYNHKIKLIKKICLIKLIEI